MRAEKGYQNRGDGHSHKRYGTAGEVEGWVRSGNGIADQRKKNRGGKKGKGRWKKENTKKREQVWGR